MSFNKAKALKAASRHVQQGKFQAAIEEYRRIVQAEPSDITTLNTLGDLYVKIGDTGEAIRTFLRIAEHYRAGSFNLKAIAMLKKVSKLDPQNVEVSLKLAGLYAQQKLIVDARHQYLTVAEHCLRAGQQKQALAIYQKIADLDPENTAIQLKLAEAYLRENQTGQAYEAFVAAASEVQRQGKYDEALEIYLKALKVSPESQGALNSVVNLYIQRGETRRAADLIVQMLQTQQGNAELLTLLGRIYQSAGNLEEAEEALTQAVKSDPSRYQYLLDLAEIALRNGDFERALHQVDRVLECLYERREEEKAIAIMHEILARDPGCFGALERLAAIFSRIREDHNLIDTLNSLADAAIRKGEDEVAIKALVQLVQLEPDEIRHRRRLRSLGLGDEEVQQMGDALPTMQPPAPGAETDEELQPQTEATFSEISVADGTHSKNQESSVQSDYREAPGFAESACEQGGLKSWNGMSASGFDAVQEEIDLSDDFQNEIVSNPLVSGDSLSEASSAPPITFSAAVTEPPVAEVMGTEIQASEQLKNSGGLNLNEELESIDFYLTQEMFDVARHTLETLERYFPDDPEVNVRRLRLDQAAGGGNTSASNDSAASAHLIQSQPDETEEAEHIVILSPMTGDQLQESGSAPHHLTGSAESFAVAEQDGAIAVTSITTNSSAPQAGSPLADLLNDLSYLQFDLAPGTAVNESATEKPTPATPDAHPVQGTASDTESSLNDLFSLFDEFRAGAEQETGAEDFETHYNLGLAYKDMEMYDEAVEEFQQAWKAVSSNPTAEARQNQLLSCSMLGFCFSQKNLPRLAVMWLKRGLEVSGRTEDEYQALRYDLATACEAMGDLKGACDVLSEVYAIDVHYRGVSEKLQSVQARLNGQ